MCVNGDTGSRDGDWWVARDNTFGIVSDLRES